MILDEKISCEKCIWRDQCASDIPCDDFDKNKNNTELLGDEEIESLIEINRAKYQEEFEEYLDSFYSDQ